MKLSFFPAGLFIVMFLIIVLAASAVGVTAYSKGWQAQQATPFAKAVDLGPQTWNLYSKKVDGGFKLDRTQDDDNFGPGTEVPVAPGASALWIAVRPEKSEFLLAQGLWNVVIITDADWGISGSLCLVEVGIWNGRSFEKFDTTVMTSNYFLPDPLKEIRQKISQKSVSVVAVNQSLALKITNLDIITHEVRTAENGYSSIIQGIYSSASSLLASPSPFRTASTPSAAQTIKSTAVLVTTGLQNPPVPTSAPSLPVQTSVPAETQVSLLGSIAGIILAMIIVVGFCLIIILVSRLLVKRKKSGSK